MTVIFDSPYLDGVNSFEIKNEDDEILEAICYAHALKQKINIFPDYFIFINDKDKDCIFTTGRYYINKKPVSRSDIEAINPQYAEFMKQNKISKAIMSLGKDREVLHFYPFFDIDKTITIN